MANQIVAVVTAERDAEINRVGLRVALEQAEITDRKRALGAANGLDVVRAQQNVANARATLVTGDESLREAREALGLALGVPEETGVSPGVDVGGLRRTRPGRAASSRRSTSGRTSPPPARSSTSQSATCATSGTRFSRRSPRRAPSAGSSLVGAGLPNPTWSIGGILQVPIWDGGTRYGNLRNARAAEDIAAQQLEALRRQAIIQVEQARRQLLVAEQSDRVAKEQRDLAAQNDQMTQLAYQTGQGTSLDS